MTCPICSKKTDPNYRPFCSKRCADVDLGRWLSGSYAVPAESPEDLDEAADALAEQARKLH
ncbi:MAG: DNA gyrase inhibitor YacG [Paracoccaceae bacterium]